ncbi:MAG: DUF3187 family protein [Deltaproteobacteria bacterium]|nr:DUF3187 family protein [Deltaproteobacteria bacterium]
MTILLLPAVAHANFYTPQGPLTLRTQNPVYLQTITLLPARAEVLPKGVLELRVDSAYSNIFEKESTPAFGENLDMELWRLGWVATYGVLPNMEVGIEVPLLHFDGGFLDSFIQNYHDFFGFPNGGRDQVADDVYNYRVTRGGGLLYNAGSQKINLGDITLFSKHQLLHEGELVPGLSWRFGFKIPSGDSEGGLGSGNAGFGFGVAMEKSYRRLHGYLNTNYLVDGGNNAFLNLMETPFFDYTLAGEYSFSEHTAAIVQLTGGTPRLKGTGLQTWDGIPMDFVIGVRGDNCFGRFAKPFFWQVGFSEDILADGPSVDFSVLFSVGIRFNTASKQH